MKKEKNIEEENLVDENIYQQFKKNMGKISDYFNIEEWEKILKLNNTIIY